MTLFPQVRGQFLLWGAENADVSLDMDSRSEHRLTRTAHELTQRLTAELLALNPERRMAPANDTLR